MEQGQVSARGVFALLGSAGTQLQAQGLGGNEDF